MIKGIENNIVILYNKYVLNSTGGNEHGRKEKNIDG